MNVDLMHKEESLHPELKPYMQLVSRRVPIPMVHHPLVVELLPDQTRCAYVNEFYKNQVDKASRALKTRQWETFVWLHARPYRLQALAEIHEQVSDEIYWQLVAGVWIDAEGSSHLNLDVWKILFTADRPLRHLLMKREERRVLNDLPENLTVYRGHRCTTGHGMSWTVDQSKALWFARRFNHADKTKAYLAEATVSKKHVLAYFDCRNEKEVVVFPENITVTKRQEI